MNRKLTLLTGVPVFAFMYACNEGTAVRTPPTLPSFQWQDNLPPPPTLSVTIVGDPNQPNNSAGTFTYTTNVSGGSGTYTYRWFYRACNINDGAEWCPNSFWDSYETGSAFTYTIGDYDSRVELVVEVQEVTSSDTPASGKGYIFSAGPMFGAEGTVEGSNPFCGSLGGYPLSRYAQNPNTGVWGWQDYRRNQCTGAVEYPAS